MNSNALIAFSLLLTLSACASTTPIAVPTPQWVVPPLSPKIAAAESAALQEAATSLADWEALVSSLPGQSATVKTP